MLRTIRSRSPLSRRALPAGVDYRLRTALRSLLAFGPTPVEMYANTSNAGLRRRIRTAPAVPFISIDTPTDAPPAPKWASFTGGDGQYSGLISRPQLLLPLRVLDAIIYQVDIASDTAFTTDLETVNEGQTRAFSKGGYSTVNRYGRVRAKFPTSAWTGWTVFGLPTAVASGTVPTDLGDLTGNLDSVADGTSFVRVIPNEKTGAGDAYEITQNGVSSNLNTQASTIPTGVTPNGFSFDQGSPSTGSGDRAWFQISWGGLTVYLPDETTFAVAASSGYAMPPDPTLSTVSGGTRAATDGRARIAYVREKTIMGISGEASIAIPANNLLKITSPSSNSKYDGWIPIAGETLTPGLIV